MEKKHSENRGICCELLEEKQGESKDGEGYIYGALAGCLYASFIWG